MVWCVFVCVCVCVCCLCVWGGCRYRWGHATAANNVFPSIVGPNETRTCGIEDPTLWLDANGIVHAVVHNWKAGGHAASSDRGRTWRWYGGNCSARVGASSIDWSRSVWPKSFAFAGDGGRQITPARRERPHIVVDPKTKQVVALTNSLQLGPADITQTLVQETAHPRPHPHPRPRPHPHPHEGAAGQV